MLVLILDPRSSSARLTQQCPGQWTHYLSSISPASLQKNFASQTIASYKSALALPITEATGLDLSDPHFTLLLKSLFLEKPLQRFPEIRWNLTEVLQFLRQPRFRNTDTSEEDLLHKCLILTALATGNCGAEMATFSRKSISHRQDGSIVLAVRPDFLYKNQSANHTPSSIVIHPLARNQLCPVLNLTQYLAKSTTTQGHLFIHPVSRRLLNPFSTGCVFCDMCESWLSSRARNRVCSP
ncbi:hypothetical protein E2C01_072116 [Portunus trituberculatus]|uniref:Uncharacterized protein n=1 Tax=Portunus trituberculatus TaxID=210409 RepID=A0A5B7I834_PORTR|nr:hypothetical protein [Portunus trituberculatus]